MLYFHFFILYNHTTTKNPTPQSIIIPTVEVPWHKVHFYQEMKLCRMGVCFICNAEIVVHCSAAKYWLVISIWPCLAARCRYVLPLLKMVGILTIRSQRYIFLSMNFCQVLDTSLLLAKPS